MTGTSQEQYAEMMLKGGRSPDRTEEETQWHGSRLAWPSHVPAAGAAMYAAAPAQAAFGRLIRVKHREKSAPATTGQNGAPMRR